MPVAVSKASRVVRHRAVHKDTGAVVGTVVIVTEVTIRKVTGLRLQSWWL